MKTIEQYNREMLFITAEPNPKKIDRTVCGFCGSKNIDIPDPEEICQCVKCKDCLRTEGTWCKYQ